MTVSSRKNWWIFIVLFMVLSPAQTRAQTLHLILAGDLNNPVLRTPIGNSQGALSTVLFSNIPQAHLSIIEGGVEVSGDWLIDTINDIPVKNGDCVFVYYMGHGSYSVTEKSHRLRYTKSPILRTKVETALRDLPFQGLRCLVTDSCATFEEVHQPREVGNPQGANTISPGIDRLFFQSQGFLNVNSCDWGQIASAYRKDSKRGQLPIGLFSSVFSEVLGENADSATVTWSSVFASTSDRTRKGFGLLFQNGTNILSMTGEAVMQTTQDPIAIGPLPEVNGSADTQKQQYFLGIRVERLQAAQGVEIYEVVTGSPATRMRRKGVQEDPNWRLEAADRILQVGGRATDNVDDLEQALRLPGPNTWLKVMDGRSGSVSDFDVVLERR